MLPGAFRRIGFQHNLLPGAFWHIALQHNLLPGASWHIGFQHKKPRCLSTISAFGTAESDLESVAATSDEMANAYVGWVGPPSLLCVPHSPLRWGSPSTVSPAAQGSFRKLG